jgi:dihydrofolate reductase
MHINLIVANSRNKAIGRDGKMPWKISKELERFKAITKYLPRKLQCFSLEMNR